VNGPKTRCVGILTAGGDCPGLNAAIRGLARSCIRAGIKVIGIRDGFRGLVENRTMQLDDASVSGILARGGTILGTSRDKPHKMSVGKKRRDMTGVAAENARRLGIDCLVCVGGGGTQKNALALRRSTGLNVMTLPKTIDNDVAGTDVSFGFDTAMATATEALDRLKDTATSHNRLIVCEVMGHTAGWLALGAGLAAGADVILIPEIEYDLSTVAEHVLARRRNGKQSSLIVVAEAARATGESPSVVRTPRRGDHDDYDLVQEPMATRLARRLQHRTETEARVTSLGHVARGGAATARDRVLCTMLGDAAAELLARGVYDVMVALRNGRCEPVPLADVAGFRKLVPMDHAWVAAARAMNTCLGDEPIESSQRTARPSLRLMTPSAPAA